MHYIKMGQQHLDLSPLGHVKEETGSSLVKALALAWSRKKVLRRKHIFWKSSISNQDAVFVHANALRKEKGSSPLLITYTCTSISENEILIWTDRLLITLRQQQKMFNRKDVLILLPGPAGCWLPIPACRSFGLWKRRCFKQSKDWWAPYPSYSPSGRQQTRSLD